MIGLGADLATPTCSRAGCHEAATWRLDWRNPKIHTEDRVKTWLACDLHREYLEDFLATRDFPLTVAPLAPAADAALPAPSHDAATDAPAVQA